jgi:hypothetical protein
MGETEAEFRERMKPVMERFYKNLDKWAAEHPEEYEAMFEEELEEEDPPEFPSLPR